MIYRAFDVLLTFAATAPVSAMENGLLLLPLAARLGNHYRFASSAVGPQQDRHDRARLQQLLTAARAFIIEHG